MEFFGNLGGILSGKGKEAADAAKKVAEVANLKGKISGLETEIRKNYAKIGEAYYEAYKDAEVTCEFEDYVQAIRDAKKAAEELKYKVNEIKGEVQCRNCGNQIKAGTAFCPNCGTKVEADFFDEEDDIIVDDVDMEKTETEVGGETCEESDSDEVEELEEVEENTAE